MLVPEQDMSRREAPLPPRLHMRLALALVAMLAASAASWLPFSAFAADPDEAPPEPISREAQLRMAPNRDFTSHRPATRRLR